MLKIIRDHIFRDQYMATVINVFDMAKIIFIWLFINEKARYLNKIQSSMRLLYYKCIQLAQWVFLSVNAFSMLR